MPNKKVPKPTYEWDNFGDKLVFSDGGLSIEIERDHCCHSTYASFDLSPEATKELYEKMKEYYEGGK